MSTLTSAQPQRGTRDDSTPPSIGTPRGRIVSGPLALVFLTEFCALTSFYLLLSVTPMYAAAVGAGSTGAGLVTGVLLLGTAAVAVAATAFGSPLSAFTSTVLPAGALTSAITSPC